VPLSAAQATIEGGETVFHYLPPHPQKGSTPHRYVYVLLEQTDRLPEVELSRSPFDLRHFASAHNLEPVGISFFKSKWSEGTSAIYKEVLGASSGRFSRPSSFSRVRRDGAALWQDAAHQQHQGPQQYASVEHIASRERGCMQCAPVGVRPPRSLRFPCDCPIVVPDRPHIGGGCISLLSEALDRDSKHRL
jgi:hypothetical protein